ncbi:MAG: hypothetical protein ACYC4H_11240, partial [Desulfocucumaceae bacterium]
GLEAGLAAGAVGEKVVRECLGVLNDALGVTGDVKQNCPNCGGPGMARFIQQYDMGTGDYTKDRINWLDQICLDEVISGINKMRKADPPAGTHFLMYLKERGD